MAQIVAGRSSWDQSKYKAIVSYSHADKERGAWFETHLERFADKCERLSAKEARPIKYLEPRSDAIGTRKALEAYRVPKDLLAERIPFDPAPKHSTPSFMTAQTWCQRFPYGGNRTAPARCGAQ